MCDRYCTRFFFFKFYMRGILSPHFREPPNKHAKQGHCSISGQIRSALLYCVSSKGSDIKLVLSSKVLLHSKITMRISR